MRWPEHSILIGMTSEREVIFRSNDRMCDLHDSLCRNLKDPLASEYFLAVNVDHPKWRVANDGAPDEGKWDEAALQEVESAIEEDFNYDDYIVFLEREAGAGWPKSCSAIWRITPMRPDYD
ncbi:hypothetical protein K3162_08185 [Qipengyuania xiapuensis]|uniref:Uncharacterized protein n=1 Tax=Qipengyuania xiapuensis TaxID=2867236 RepID=A0ABX8ZRE2_9SPHN|nr:hypothetical protein [Qipengyuania xiapuensis]QZD91551.1 hypothetical protein K3162_08185 [Qipengyuania xiapuensis]